MRNNRESRRKSEKEMRRLRKQIGKAFDMLTPEEQDNVFAQVLAETAKVEAKLAALRRNKEDK